ncbi:CPBP family intramembrane glutamic endopeptidase [Wukongibacter baidiensis]|uniref:CPBP family intramembrane glutamic endopeptidase n=1 Tax=Wukongibacter baidiensis TaxID=1723361 RepID=UPI003D7FECF6
MGVLSIVFIIVMFILVIAFLIEFFSKKQRLKDNIKYGIFFAIVIFLLDGFITLIRMGEFLGFAFFMVIVVVFLRTIMFVSVGNYHCMKMNIKDVPLIRRLFNYWERRNGNESDSEILEEYSKECDDEERVCIEPYDSEVSSETDTEEKEILNESCIDVEWKKFFLWTAIVLIASIAYSVILFKLTSPEPSQALKDMIGGDVDLKSVGFSDMFHVGIMVFVIALNEEIMFRLGIQNFLAVKFKLQDNKYWIAIVLTSILWSIGHANTLSPEWVKFAQVFPIGIALGFLFRRFGLESTMIVHGVLNVVMMMLQISEFIKV